MGNCDPGLREHTSLKVREENTALAIGSGTVPVLGTPAVLELAERACVAAICNDLDEGQTSVGTWAEVNHDKPSAIGDEVTADATLVGHHGRRLEFSVIVRSGDVVVAKVRHRRVLVDEARFMGKVNAAAGAA